VVATSNTMRTHRPSEAANEMGHKFEGGTQAELDATPEQVWEAIATGPDIDSWFMGPEPTGRSR
jgi:hypothetical protein